MDQSAGVAGHDARLAHAYGLRFRVLLQRGLGFIFGAGDILDIQISVWLALGRISAS